jgi:hypothetical protein
MYNHHEHLCRRVHSTATNVKKVYLYIRIQMYIALIITNVFACLRDIATGIRLLFQPD